VILVRLDLGVVAAVCSRVLAQHPHGDVHDVFRISKPDQGMVKIVDEPATERGDGLRKQLTLEYGEQPTPQHKFIARNDCSA
jgi:hypothetical protein